MTAAAADAERALQRSFCLDYPRQAARELEQLGAEPATVRTLSALEGFVLAPVVGFMSADTAARLLSALPAPRAAECLNELDLGTAGRITAQLDEPDRATLLAHLPQPFADELRRHMEYVPDTAGYLMDRHFVAVRATTTAEQALERLRGEPSVEPGEVFLIDEEGRLAARVTVHALAVAAPETPVEGLSRPVTGYADVNDSRAEVIETLGRHLTPTLPVVDYAGRLLGLIRQDTLMNAVQAEVSADMQTMVGASKDERALSRVGFAVSRRLPWLHINLLTAFLAAAVVGLFEDVIAQVTALAVLMPVVAGQSGNTGAQALAVTMRGLALREIGTREWWPVLWKEVRVAILNGLGIAVTTSIGVYLWTPSLGLVAIIASAMVISMLAAGMAGAIIPVVLMRLGQDPAQSSSIVLTTVTDVVGFMSFLGIGALLAHWI